MIVLKATNEDLETLLNWLEREYDEDHQEGFWCNRSIIVQALEDGHLWIIRHEGQAIAFQVGEYSADIVSVRKEFRQRGCGRALFASSCERALANNVNVLLIECSPRSSWPFWERLGFERYGDMSERGRITARRILLRSFDIPPELPRVDVTIAFYPEAATYTRDVPPIRSHRVQGGRLDNGAIMLERRIIGICRDEPEGKDLAIKIEVDGELRCFGKAKHEEAQEAGVTRDWKGSAYFIDIVQPHHS